MNRILCVAIGFALGAASAGPGSLILQSSNELHGLTNVGADTAVYWVIAIYPRDLRDSTDRR
jgi:hypothetical protein